MKRGLTGKYEISTVDGEPVQAFIPFDLPPEPPIEFSGARRRLIERATISLGGLDSIALLLPDPNLFLYSYVRREAVLSSQIEGTQSSFSDLLLFELQEAPGIPIDDVVEVSNYVAAMEYGIQRLKEGFPLCNRLIREVHGKLLSKGRGSQRAPGEFRRSQNWIGGTRPGNAYFVPVPPDKVETSMASLERFFHDESAPYPVLLKAAFTHVQFETIHPFLDGNGRVGRLLIALLLHETGILSQPLLYLSLYFKQHREMYYSLLDAVRTEGDWESWIDFFLEGVVQTAGGALKTAKRLVTLFNDDTAKIQKYGRNASTTLRVFNILCKRPLLTVNEAKRQTELSFPAVNKAMETLIKIDIVRELTGGKRNRVFAYQKYLSTLLEGTEAE
ncbi:MAG: Fic family protein [Candidatus Marinimicrobia bacterium]|jgi:Fic family protein|nr:Fic family protein [Candidatus Neomarinimicrobiota bacterium]